MSDDLRADLDLLASRGIDVARPSKRMRAQGWQWVATLPGCQQHLTTDGLREFAANERELARKDGDS